MIPDNVINAATFTVTFLVSSALTMFIWLSMIATRSLMSRIGLLVLFFAMVVVALLAPRNITISAFAGIVLASMVSVGALRKY